MKKRAPGDYAELLRAGRWFSALPADLQAALLKVSALRPLTAGERLFSRGDAPTGLFAVLSGAIRITASAESGKEALLTLAEAPAWFGEIAVVDGLARTHDAIAEGEALVLQIPQRDLLQLLEKEPRWWRDLALLLAGKLRLAFLSMEETSLLPAATRLARRLVLMAEGYGEWQGRSSRILDVRQEQLAMMLSLSRQTANQVLKDLEARGLLRLTYGEIEIVDLDGLRAAADPG